MAKIPINPKHWRERAEEARTVAEEMTRDADDTRSNDP
jgi:hypothetical protein